MSYTKAKALFHMTVVHLNLKYRAMREVSHYPVSSDKLLL